MREELVVEATGSTTHDLRSPGEKLRNPTRDDRGESRWEQTTRGEDGECGGGVTAAPIVPTFRGWQSRITTLGLNELSSSPSPIIMPLSDLTKHIPDQTKAISRFTRGIVDTTSVWARFRKSLWGKGLDSLQQQEPVERDIDPIEDVHVLPDTPPATRSVAILPETLGWNPASIQRRGGRREGVVVRRA